MNNKQAHDITTVENLEQRQGEVELVRQHIEQTFRLYHTLLESGWPRELSRGVLQVNTYSPMFGTVNLLNLFKFIGLRLHPHAQHEIRGLRRGDAEPDPPHCTGVRGGLRKQPVSDRVRDLI